MATRDDRAASGFLLTVVTSAMILTLLVPVAEAGAARTPADHPLDLTAVSLATTDREASGLDAHGVTASILAGRSSNVADFVRRWEDRIHNGEGFDTAGPDGDGLSDDDKVADGVEVQEGKNPLDPTDNQTPERPTEEPMPEPSPQRQRGIDVLHHLPRPPGVRCPRATLASGFLARGAFSAGCPGRHGQNRQMREEWANFLAGLAGITARSDP